MATSIPPERILAALREALCDRNDVFTFTSSALNTALARSAELEDDMQLVDTLVDLDLSPMFGLALAECEIQLLRIGVVLPLDKNGDTLFAVRMLCARCYLAGTVTAKGGA